MILFVLRLTNQEACLVLAQILNALEYLHEMDISHRDLKPENLLFDRNYELKLVDFGLSKKNTQGSEQHLFTCCGSPCYASPETISSQPYIGKYVDLWSVGIILFAMVCGFLPFDDDNQAVLFQKIITCEYIIPKDISPEVAYIIKGLLLKDPRQRMSIQDIKNSPFYQNYMNGAMVRQGIRIGLESIPVDLMIVQIMEEQGIERKIIIESITKNQTNSVSATYYLLKLKIERNQIHLNSYVTNNHSTKNDIQQDQSSSPVSLNQEYNLPSSDLNNNKEIQQYDQNEKHHQHKFELIEQSLPTGIQKHPKKQTNSVDNNEIIHIKHFNNVNLNNKEINVTPTNSKNDRINTGNRQQTIFKKIKKQYLDYQTPISSNETKVLSQSSSGELENQLINDRRKLNSSSSSSSDSQHQLDSSVGQKQLKKSRFCEDRQKYPEVNIKHLIEKLLNQGTTKNNKAENLLKRQSLPNFQTVNIDQTNQGDNTQSIQQIQFPKTNNIAPKSTTNYSSPTAAAAVLHKKCFTPQFGSSKQIPIKIHSAQSIKLPSEMIPAASERKSNNYKKTLCIQNNKTLDFLNNVNSYSPQSGLPKGTLLNSSKISQEIQKVIEKGNNLLQNKCPISTLATASSTTDIQRQETIDLHQNLESLNSATSIHLNIQPGITQQLLNDNNNMSILELQNCIVDTQTPLQIQQDSGFKQIGGSQQCIPSQPPQWYQDRMLQSAKYTSQEQSQEDNSPNSQNNNSQDKNIHSQKKLYPSSEKSISLVSCSSDRNSSTTISKGKYSLLESNEQETSINYHILNINQLIQASVKPEHNHIKKSQFQNLSREKSQEQIQFQTQERSVSKESNLKQAIQTPSKQMKRMNLLLGKEPSAKVINSYKSSSKNTQSLVLTSYNSPTRNNSRIEQPSQKSVIIQKQSQIEDIMGIHSKRHSSAGENIYSKLIKNIKKDKVLTQQTPSPKRTQINDYSYQSLPQSMLGTHVPSPINFKFESKKKSSVSQNMIDSLTFASSKTNNIRKSLDSSGLSSPKSAQNKNKKQQFLLGSTFLHSQSVLSCNQEDLKKYKSSGFIKQMMPSSINQNLKLVSTKNHSLNISTSHEFRKNNSLDKKIHASVVNSTEKQLQPGCQNIFSKQIVPTHPIFSSLQNSQPRIGSPKNSQMSTTKQPNFFLAEQQKTDKNNLKKVSSSSQITNKLPSPKNIGKITSFATMNILSSDSKTKSINNN